MLPSSDGIVIIIIIIYNLEKLLVLGKKKTDFSIT